MQKADGQLLELIERLPLCVSSEFDSNQAFCDLPLPLLLIAASSELRKISPALPAEWCLEGVCIRGLNQSDGTALQLGHGRLLSVVSPLISLLSKLLKLILVLQLLARVKLHFY